MSLNFPSTPAVNDLYTLGTRTWKYNGNGWAVVTPQGELGFTGSRSFVGSFGFTGSLGFTGSIGNRGGLRYYYDSNTAAGITACLLYTSPSPRD